MLTEQIAERLPWGIIEYDMREDAVWWGGGEDEPYTGKPAQIPDWYERKYQKKDDYFPRSLVQLLYEETGCLMPRDLHLYDRRAKELGRYGVRGKDATIMLTMMTALSNARYQNSAVNLRPWDDSVQPEETEQDESSQELKAERSGKKANGSGHPGASGSAKHCFLGRAGCGGNVGGGSKTQSALLGYKGDAGLRRSR